MFCRKHLVLLLVLLFGLFGVSTVFGQSDPYITEFRITPIGRTHLVRHPELDYPAISRWQSVRGLRRVRRAGVLHFHHHALVQPAVGVLR